MSLEYDVAIIGGGMAGLVAGISSAQSGQRTLVIRKGQGATAMSSGAIDVAGFAKGGEAHFLSPDEGITALAALSPYHPYKALQNSEESSLSTFLSSSIDWLKETLAGSSAELVGSAEATLMALTVLGTKKPTTLLQKTMHSSHLSNPEESLLLVGLKGLPDFNPSAVSKSIMEYAARENARPRKIIHTMLDYVPFDSSSNISPIEIARHMENEDELQNLGKALQSKVEATGATVVGLPPVLGVQHSVTMKEQLEERLGVEVFELLAVPPSVPGFRLQRALESAFKNAGGDILLGHEAVSSKSKDGLLDTIDLRSPRRRLEVSARSFILATGKFIGGGVTGSRKGLREPVFGLPIVDGKGELASEIRPYMLTEKVPLPRGGHQLFECGIGFDSLYRPILEDGSVFSPNLFAAGAILSGYNFASEKSGLGVALLTGRMTGLQASRFSKGGS